MILYYIHTSARTPRARAARAGRGPGGARRQVVGGLAGQPGPQQLYWKLRGSQGMGVVGNNWFDGVLLSILYRFKP